MQKFLGMDFSMHELYRDSNGKEPAYPKYYRNAEKKFSERTTQAFQNAERFKQS